MPLSARSAVRPCTGELTMKCDHPNCKSRFCPHCGEPVRDHDLDTLRSYLAKSLLSCYSARDTIMRSYSHMPDVLESSLESNAKKIDKWQRWIDCLDGLTGHGGEQ